MSIIRINNAEIKSEDIDNIKELSPKSMTLK